MDRYPYQWYTILLGATRALAHTGAYFYTSRFRPFKFLAPLPGTPAMVGAECLDGVVGAHWQSSFCLGVSSLRWLASPKGC